LPALFYRSRREESPSRFLFPFPPSCPPAEIRSSTLRSSPFGVHALKGTFDILLLFKPEPLGDIKDYMWIVFQLSSIAWFFSFFPPRRFFLPFPRPGPMLFFAVCSARVDPATRGGLLFQAFVENFFFAFPPFMVSGTPNPQSVLNSLAPRFPKLFGYFFPFPVLYILGPVFFCLKSTRHCGSATGPFFHTLPHPGPIEEAFFPSAVPLQVNPAFPSTGFFVAGFFSVPALRKVSWSSFPFFFCVSQMARPC